MNNFDLKRMHTFDSHKKVSHPKIRSRFGWSFSNCELTTRLSDHIDLRIDIILIILVKAWSKFSFENNIKMSNSVASDQVRCSVGPDLCSNYLQTPPACQQTTKLPISRKRVNTGNKACFLSSADFFFKNQLSWKTLSGLPSVSKYGSSSGPTF